jgi:hypothetical protein
VTAVRVRIIEPKADNGLAVPKYEARGNFKIKDMVGGCVGRD